MTSIVQLGRLEPVQLRNAWPNEASNFTRWLAEEANLSLLGDTLGLRLELEGVEKQVGAFSADILAKDSATGQWIVIENQIAPTDHGHLGQLLTYAAGFDARKIIWIAEVFRDEHRAAIEYLNKATADDFSFFAIQIELWRIGDSQPAPRFSVLTKPNNWNRQAQAAKKSAEEELTPSQKNYNDFWSSLIQKATTRYPALAARQPYKNSFQIADTLIKGNPTVTSTAAFTSDKKLRCEIYIDGTAAKAAFAWLLDRRSEVESGLEQKLAWDPLPGARASRIACYMQGIQKCSDKSQWDLQQEWLLTWWPRLVAAVVPILQQMPVESFLPAETEQTGLPPTDTREQAASEIQAYVTD